MPIGNIWSGISFRHDDSIFIALAEPCSHILVFTFSGKKPNAVVEFGSKNLDKNAVKMWNYCLKSQLWTPTFPISMK